MTHDERIKRLETSLELINKYMQLNTRIIDNLQDSIDLLTADDAPASATEALLDDVMEKINRRRSLGLVRKEEQ